MGSVLESPYLEKNPTCNSTYCAWGMPQGQADGNIPEKGRVLLALMSHGGPHNKDYNLLGSILGSPHFGKLYPALISGESSSFPHPARHMLCKLNSRSLVAGCWSHDVLLDTRSHQRQSQRSCEETNSLEPLFGLELPHWNFTKC